MPPAAGRHFLADAAPHSLHPVSGLFPPRTRPGWRGARAAADFPTAVLAATCVLSLVALGACAGDRPSDREGEEGDRARPLVLGYSSELQTLNPVVSTDQMANEIMWYLLYTPLVVYDSTFRVRPWLAESWELAEDAVTFRLREDVRWHDGEPVTAEDVQFTFALAKHPDVGSPLGAAYLGEVEDAEVLGPHEIRFAFERPHAQPLESFFWPPVPKHLLEDVAPADLSRHPFNRRPTGSGPYRLTEWTVSQRVAMQAMPEFPEALGGPAGISRLLYRIVPEPTTLLREFLRGEVQLHGPLNPADADRVREASDVELVSFPWRMFTYVGWNTRREPFAEAEVRRALAMAIDRQALLDAVLRGHGRLAAGPVPPWHPLAPDAEPLPYAPDSARAILERQGWRDADGDGVRERDGRPFRFVLLTNQRNPVYGDLAQVIQAHLARVGVAVEPRLLEWQTVLTRHRQRDFDAVLTNWVLDNFRVDPRPLFHGSQAAVEGSANRSSYENSRADSLMDLGVRTAEEERAREIWGQLTELLRRDQPITFLFWNDDLAGVSRELEGVRMDARGELVTVPRWRWRGAESDGTAAGDSPSAEGSP